MAHYDDNDGFYPTIEETLKHAQLRVMQRQADCKHQWMMHEVTIEGKPVSVTCMHCRKVHRIEKEPDVKFEPKVGHDCCHHSYKYLYRNAVMRTITCKCKHCGDIKEIPDDEEV